MNNIIHWIIDAAEPFNGVTQSFTCMKDGIERVAYTDLTLADYMEQAEKPYKIIKDEELDALLREYENGLVTDWQEITESRYFEMLEVLPPCKYENGRFHISERLTGDLVAWFKREGGKFYEKTDYSTAH